MFAEPSVRIALPVFKWRYFGSLQTQYILRTRASPICQHNFLFPAAIKDAAPLRKTRHRIYKMTTKIGEKEKEILK